MPRPRPPPELASELVAVAASPPKGRVSGAARIAEQGLRALVEQYGRDLIERFVEEWFDYSERTIASVISTMPSVSFTGTGRHDPLPVLPDGVPISVSVTIKPEDGIIEVDLTDNIDCVDAGMNESRTCAMNNVMTGVFNSIDPDIPHNAGTSVG